MGHDKQKDGNMGGSDIQMEESTMGQEVMVKQLPNNLDFTKIEESITSLIKKKIGP